MKTFKEFIRELTEGTAFVGKTMSNGEVHHVYKNHDGSYEVQNRRTGEKQTVSSLKDLDKSHSWLDESLTLGILAAGAGMAIGSRINDTLKGKDPKDGDKSLFSRIKNLRSKSKEAKPK